MRRPSSHYIRRVKLRFRFAQVMFNALALIAIAGGMAAYFKGAQSQFCITNLIPRFISSIPYIHTNNK